MQEFDRQDTSKATPSNELLDSILRGDILIVSDLLLHGADPNFRLPDGMTLLHHAALEGHSEVVGLLIAKGAAVDADDTSIPPWKPLHYAIFHGRAEVEKLLLDAGAQINTPRLKTVLFQQKTPPQR